MAERMEIRPFEPDMDNTSVGKLDRRSHRSITAPMDIDIGAFYIEKNS